MAEIALDINPELEIKIFDTNVTDINIHSFLENAALVVDGLDLFAMPAQRLLFQHTSATEHTQSQLALSDSELRG